MMIWGRLKFALFILLEQAELRLTAFQNSNMDTVNMVFILQSIAPTTDAVYVEMLYKNNDTADATKKGVRIAPEKRYPTDGFQSLHESKGVGEGHCNL